MRVIKFLNIARLKQDLAKLIISTQLENESLSRHLRLTTKECSVLRALASETKIKEYLDQFGILKLIRLASRVEPFELHLGVIEENTPRYTSTPNNGREVLHRHLRTLYENSGVDKYVLGARYGLSKMNAIRAFMPLDTEAWFKCRLGHRLLFELVTKASPVIWVVSKEGNVQ
jgi:hypothetical protein